jgi:hypothetical protein
MINQKGYLRNQNIKPIGVKLDFTKEQVEEYLKCANDPIYFAKKYIKVVSLDKGLVAFNLYDFQERMVHTLQNNRFVIGKMPRQSGKTTTVACCYLLHKVLFNQSMNIAILANKLQTSREILARVKEAYEHLPWWLQQGVIEWNKGSIALENGSRILAAATSSSAIRGGSFNIIFLDEFAHVPPGIAEEFFNSVYPTITAGQTTQVIIISTPNGLNMFYHFWKGAINHINEYAAVEVHWHQVPEYPGGPLRSPEWKKKTIENTSERQFQQEFECDFIGSSNTLISSTKLNTMVYSPPKIKNKDGFWVYDDAIKQIDDETKDHVYFMCVDPSRGQGKDYSAVTVIDVTEMPYKVVAKYRNNIVSPLVLPSIVRSIGKRYNNAYVLVEVNDIGGQIADILHVDLEYENLIKVNQLGRKGQIISEFGSSKGQQFGVRTTTVVKKLGCSVLKNLIEQEKLIIEDIEIIDELTTFIAAKTSYEADGGHNDDLVMCLVLFAWATRQDFFKNLTNLDVRLEMFSDEIEKIESDIMPFGFFDDGGASMTTKEGKLELIDNDLWLISDKIPRKIYIPEQPLHSKEWFF